MKALNLKYFTVVLSFLSGEIVTKALNFLSIPVFAALVSKQDFAIFYIDYFTVVIAVGICNLCIWEASLRFTRRRERLIPSLSFFKLLSCYNFLVASVMACVKSVEFGALYMACWLLIYWQYELRSRGKSLGFSLLNTLNALAMFIVGVILVRELLEMQFNLLYVVYITGALISIYLFFTEKLRRDDEDESIELRAGLSRYVSYSAPLVLNYFSWWFFLGGYLVIFDMIRPNFDGRDDMVVATRLFGVFSLIATVTSMSLQHFRFLKSSTETISVAQNMIFFVFLLPLFWCAVVVIELLASFVFPAEFLASLELLYPLATLGWVLALNQVLGTDLLVQDKSSALMFSNVTGIVVAITICGLALIMELATPSRLIFLLSLGALGTFVIRLQMLGYFSMSREI